MTIKEYQQSRASGPYSKQAEEQKGVGVRLSGVDAVEWEGGKLPPRGTLSMVEGTATELKEEGVSESEDLRGAGRVTDVVMSTRVWISRSTWESSRQRRSLLVDPGGTLGAPYGECVVQQLAHTPERRDPAG